MQRDRVSEGGIFGVVSISSLDRIDDSSAPQSLMGFEFCAM